MEYKLLFAYNAREFEKLMGDVIIRGWRPSGSFVRTADQSYYQPITRTRAMRLWVHIRAAVSGESRIVHGPQLPN